MFRFILTPNNLVVVLKKNSLRDPNLPLQWTLNVVTFQNVL